LRKVLSCRFSNDKRFGHLCQYPDFSLQDAKLIMKGINQGYFALDYYIDTQFIVKWKIKPEQLAT
jgi:hypothetical protein